MVKCRKAILVLFIAAAIAGLFLSRLVSVNYDITDYLPPDSPSTVALDVMGEEFDGGIPNARVMIRDVSVVQALEYKEKLKQIDGVQEVTWLDDVVDVREPLEMQETDTVEAYYKDDTALFTVTVEEEKRLEAVEAMRELVGGERCADRKRGFHGNGNDGYGGGNFQNRSSRGIVCTAGADSDNKFLGRTADCAGRSWRRYFNQQRVESHLREISFVTNAAGSIFAACGIAGLFRISDSPV